MRLRPDSAGVRSHAHWTDYVYGPTGQPIAEILPSGSTYYYSRDALGSTRALTDSTGAVQNTDTYDPYGNLTASTGSVQNNLLFAAQYLDSESSLYYLRAREYDPVTGQFLTIDPAVASTMSAYAYTLGDPVNAVDPSGKNPCSTEGNACTFASRVNMASGHTVTAAQSNGYNYRAAAYAAAMRAAQARAVAAEMAEPLVFKDILGYP